MLAWLQMETQRTRTESGDDTAELQKSNPTPELRTSQPGDFTAPHTKAQVNNCFPSFFNKFNISDIL